MLALGFISHIPLANFVLSDDTTPAATAPGSPLLQGAHVRLHAQKCSLNRHIIGKLSSSLPPNAIQKSPIFAAVSRCQKMSAEKQKHQREYRYRLPALLFALFIFPPEARVILHIAMSRFTSAAPLSFSHASLLASSLQSQVSHKISFLFFSRAAILARRAPRQAGEAGHSRSARRRITQ